MIFAHRHRMVCHESASHCLYATHLCACVCIFAFVCMCACTNESQRGLANTKSDSAICRTIALRLS